MSDDDSVSIFLHELENEKNKGVNLKNIPKKSIDRKINNNSCSSNNNFNNATNICDKL